uniref:MYND-type domain-containing protein n=1 Tax=Panagrellus redivivus TaxID=6233 RepID=A0A7E4UZ60_PANRE
MASETAETPAKKGIDFYPFAYALYTENSADYCWNCFSERKNLKICQGCRTAWFCNESCINLGWKDHKVECGALKKSRTMPDIEVRILGRIVTRHKDITTGADKEDPNFYLNRSSGRQIMDIWAHVDKIRNDNYAITKFDKIYQQLVAFYGEDNLLDKETVFQLHCRDFINRHAISDKHYMKEIGKGLYLDLCAYDHSCAPNTIYVCDGIVATLCALNSSVNLADRSKTFYSYIELVLAKQQRRKLLKDTWYFDCECDRCKDNDEHILTAMKCPHCEPEHAQTIPIFGNQPYKNPETQQIICPKCNQEVTQKEVLDALSATRFITDLLDKQELEQMKRSLAFDFATELIGRFKKFLPQCNVSYCKLIEAAIRFVDPQDHQKILELYREAEACVRICFPQNHPALAFHLRNIGLEYYRLERFDDAIKYLEEAAGMFEFVMPVDHPLAKSSRAVLATVKVKAAERNNEPAEKKDEPSHDQINAPPEDTPAPEKALPDDTNKEAGAASEVPDAQLPEKETLQDKDEEKRSPADADVSVEAKETVQPPPALKPEPTVATREVCRQIAQGFLKDDDDELPELMD